MAAADAAQSHRARVVARALLHAAQVAGVVVLFRAIAEFPWAAAAAPSVLRVAASFLSPQRLCFIVGNIIVIVLATCFPPEAVSFSPSSFAGDASGSPSPMSSSSSGDAAPEQHPLLAALLDASRTPPQQSAEADASGEVVFEDKQAVHVKTVARASQPPRRTVPEKTGAGAADKEVVVRAKAARAQPPRRTVSEKTTGGAVGGATTAAPELRRAKSENGRRRQRRSAAAAAAAAAAQAELGADDEEAFRQLVESFIAKQQTLFQREESLVVARDAAAGGCAEDGPGIAGAAAVAVK